jgi:hypothetical protein
MSIIANISGLTDKCITEAFASVAKDVAGLRVGRKA